MCVTPSVATGQGRTNSFARAKSTVLGSPDVIRRHRQGWLPRYPRSRVCSVNSLPLLEMSRLPTAANWHPGAIPITVFNELCLDFVNSEVADHRGSGARFDRLALPEWRLWFLRRWDLPGSPGVGPDTIVRLKKLRAQMRRGLITRALSGPAEAAELNRLLAASPPVWRLTVGESSRSKRSLTFEQYPSSRGWDAVVARLVQAFAELMTSDRLARVRPCSNPHCSFIFFDDSSSGTRRWCDPAICGNIERVREFRARRRRQHGRRRRRPEPKPR